MSRRSGLQQSLAQAAATLLLGGAGGLLFFHLGSPAPFMLGALLTCWLLGALLPPVRRAIGMALPIRRVFLALAATLLGSFVTAHVLLSLARLWPSLVVLLVTGVMMTWASFFYLHRLRRLDPAVAWFSAQPAGLSEIVLLSANHTDKDHLVALFHLVRVTSVFICTPVIVWVAASDFQPQQLPRGQLHLWQVDPVHWLGLLLIAALGVWLGRRIRLPMANLLGPLMLSALLFGLYSLDANSVVQRPWELVCLVQVALGGSVGARMAQVSPRELARHAVDAYVNAGLMLAITLLGALLLWQVTGDSPFKFLLALAPGGLSELSLLAAALGYEVAFVTLHHLIRMAFILLILPAGTRLAIGASPARTGEPNPQAPR